MASAVTVRSMLAMILENNLQMDDMIEFRLSNETLEARWIFYDIDFVRIENQKIIGEEFKRLVMFFDLNDITED